MTISKKQLEEVRLDAYNRGMQAGIAATYDKARREAAMSIEEKKLRQDFIRALTNSLSANSQALNAVAQALANYRP